MKQHKQQIIKGIVAVCITGALFALAACHPGQGQPRPDNKDSGGSAVLSPFAMNPTGPVSSEHLDPNIKDPDAYKDQFPELVASYEANEIQSNDHPGAYPSNDFTEMYPNIKYIYKGYGYSKEYSVPLGHTSALETVKNTLRPHPYASCLSCKTPYYMVLEQEYGDEFYKMDFNEMAAKCNTGIACYDCHENEPGVMHMNRTNLVNAMNEYDIKIDPRMQVCAQCHNDYYADPKTGAITNPYSHGVSPDGMLQHYNDHNIVDYTHPDSGVKVAHVQHPDYEAYHTSSHAKMGLVCSDCHMAREEGYRSHTWTSPLASDTIMQNVCLGCHTSDTQDGLADKVNSLQKTLDDKQVAVSDKLVQVHQRIAANAEGLSEAELEEVRDMTRSAQFYWTYFFSQNGDGFHNPQESREVLDKADKFLDDINAKFDAKK